ncbi:hypothetical protein [Streptomyces phaeochromogenes]|uniref:hypothetical protein n=1 Tax=Streptomyces phaeochromogenes TaxID=1923 RepID=UPI00386EC57C|nr:hypothetical protein OG277_38350 [Streptomyces phaeochromogenes]
MTRSARAELDFASLIGALVACRTDLLQGQPSDRTLAKAAKVSPTTIGQWLRSSRFPQEIDPLLAMVRAVRLRAEAAGVAHNPIAATVLDEQEWRRSFRAEARQRAQSTSAAVEAAQSRSVLEQMQPGVPLQELTDPFHLEVKRAIEAPRASLPPLPAYVSREHDRALAQVVDQAADGENGIAVLVGGSSTGKTRALWEALNRLRTRTEPWRLWHPTNHQHPDAALNEVAHLSPHTVVWLNEAQLYLNSRLGEQIASGLRTRLRDTQDAPVLVLATLWPDHWRTLTTRTDAADAHSQARELLNGRRITVPSAFTGADLTALAGARSDDPRLKEAADHARDGHVIQYLAGGPVLLDRYLDAPPTTRALIDAAMDARRLGAGPHIPSAWLAHAAPGYLTESEWEYRSDDWLEQALAYVTTRHNGISAILTPVKASKPRNHRTTGRIDIASSSAAEHRPQAGQDPLYRLADYLDQYGRHHRAGQIPPIDFWTAAAAYAHTTDLWILGDAAQDRGLYRDAAQLYKHATASGSAAAATALIKQLHLAHIGSSDAYDYAATHTSLDDADEVAGLLNVLREVGAQEQVAALLARDPATHVSLDDPSGVAGLLNVLREVGAQEQVAALLARDPATHVDLDHRRAVAWLLHALHEAEALEQLSVLAERAVAHTSPDDLYTIARRLDTLRKVGAQEQVTALIEHAVAYASFDDLQLMVGLLELLDRTGAQEQVAALLARDPATHVSLDDPNGVGGLLDVLREVGAQEQVAALLARDPATHVSLDDPNGVGGLLDVLREVGAQEQVAALLARDPATHVSLDDPNGVAWLLHALGKIGAQEQKAVLAERVVTHADLDDPDDVARLLRTLHRAGAQEQVALLLARDPATHISLNHHPFLLVELLEVLHELATQEQVAGLAEHVVTRADRHDPDDPDDVSGKLDVPRRIAAQEQLAALLARNPAAHVSLDDPHGMGQLLDVLREIGAQEQVAALLARDLANHISLDSRGPVTLLPRALRKVEAQEQALALIERLPAAGMFDRFLEICDLQEHFTFGREPNGDAAAPWLWEDLM